jgi:hypothetical protein
MSEYIFSIQLSVPAEMRDRFNVVYDTDHLPNMIRIPEVIDCARYELKWSDNSDMLEYLAIYRIRDPLAPLSDEWKLHGAIGAWPSEIRPFVTARRAGVYQTLSRFETSQPSGKLPPSYSDMSDYIYFLQQSVPPALEAKFNDLYESNHIPLMLQAAGVNACTRFRLLHLVAGPLPEYLAIYDIAEPQVPRSAEWKRQTNSGAWPEQIRPHFTARVNGVFHKTLHLSHAQE